MLILTGGFSGGGASPSFQWKVIAAGPAKLASVGMCARVPHMTVRPGSRKQEG